MYRQFPHHIETGDIYLLSPCDEPCPVRSIVVTQLILGGRASFSLHFTEKEAEAYGGKLLACAVVSE